ncbi:MAG: hypothetical protein VYD85_08915, partial [Pseudomonadota bacterium]|nr:hypothetical protein [Pseudomonadota bacterium]
GMSVTPYLHSLPPGKLAFHIHWNPDYGPSLKNSKMVAGLKAGGHYDPSGIGLGHKHGHGHGGHCIVPHSDQGCDIGQVEISANSRLVDHGPPLRHQRPRQTERRRTAFRLRRDRKINATSCNKKSS